MKRLAIAPAHSIVREHDPCFFSEAVSMAAGATTAVAGSDPGQAEAFGSGVSLRPPA